MFYYKTLISKLDSIKIKFGERWDFLKIDIRFVFNRLFSNILYFFKSDFKFAEKSSRKVPEFPWPSISSAVCSVANVTSLQCCVKVD